MSRQQAIEQLLKLGFSLANSVKDGGDGSAYLADTFLGGYGEILNWQRPRLPVPTAELASLTEREREVVVLYGAGVPAHIVGRRLGIATGTVKIHLQHARSKAGAR